MVGFGENQGSLRGGGCGRLRLKDRESGIEIKRRILNLVRVDFYEHWRWLERKPANCDQESNEDYFTLA